MILVIAGHCQLVTEVPYIMPALYSFHMPLFFIISGFFVKRKPLMGGADLKLVKYYLATGILIAAYMLIFKDSTLKVEFLRIIWANGTPNGWGLFHEMPSIAAIWFLAALFVGRILFKFILQQNNNMEFSIIGVFKMPALYISVLLSIIVIFASKYIRLPLCFLAGINSVFYLFVGNQTKNSGFLKKIPLWLLLIIGIPTLLFNARYGFTVVSICSYFNGSMGFKGVIGFLSGIVISLMVVKLFVKYGNFSSKLLQFVGQNTLIILCVHCFMEFFVLKGVKILPQEAIYFPLELIIRLSYTLLITLIVVKIKDYFNSNKTNIVCQ